MVGHITTNNFNIGSLSRKLFIHSGFILQSFSFQVQTKFGLEKINKNFRLIESEDYDDLRR